MMDKNKYDNYSEFCLNELCLLLLKHEYEFDFQTAFVKLCEVGMINIDENDYISWDDTANPVVILTAILTTYKLSY